jgi:glycopeptide antibiotics resistance protein
VIIGRRVTIVAFVVYLALLSWIILWKLQPPYVGSGALRGIKLVPYLGAGGDGGSALLEILFNAILFIPFGVFLGLLARSWRWWMCLVVLVGTSVVFEMTQFVLAIGHSDITDVINNTLGGLIGLGLLGLARRRSKERADAVVATVLLIATCILLLAAGLFVLSPIQFHDARN